jgi:hypothetical protein
MKLRYVVGGALLFLGLCGLVVALISHDAGAALLFTAAGFFAFVALAHHRRNND